MKKIAALLTFIMFLSASLYAQLDFSEIFDRFEMKSDYLIEDIFFEDLNEDNLKDTLIIAKTPENKKLLIFFQKSDGFSSAPSQILHIDEKAIIFDVGNISDQYPYKEIVYLTNTSLNYYYFEENSYTPEPIKLIDVSSIFQAPSPESPVRSKFIRDVKGEKLGKLFIPEPENLKSFQETKTDLSMQFRK